MPSTNVQSSAVLRKPNGAEKIGLGAGTVKQKMDNLPGVKSGAFVIFDDGNAVSKTELIPLADSVGVPYGLALFVSGMASSYTYVQPHEVIDRIKAYGIEVFSHSSNSVPLDAAMAKGYGEGLLKSAADFFNSAGFDVNGFVAPSSVLDGKFLPELKSQHDFAFVRGVGDQSSDSSVNKVSSEMYNLTRVSLEASGMTLAKAKALVDYVVQRDLGEFVVFYTHTDTGWIQELLEYIRDQNAVVRPSDWVAQIKPMKKNVGQLFSPNLLINSKLIPVNGVAEGWGYSSGTLGASATYSQKDYGYYVDIQGVAAAANEESNLSQRFYTAGGIQKMSVFNASCKVTGLAAGNAILQVGIFAKDAADATIVGRFNEYEIAGNEMMVDVSIGVIPSADVDNILVQYKLKSMGSGTVRCILSEPKLNRSGKIQPYDPTDPAKYYGVFRRITGQTVAALTEQKVVFDQKLEGFSGGYDLVDGVFVGASGRRYKMVAQLGFQNMVAGDEFSIKFKKGVSVVREMTFTAKAGKNVVECTLPYIAGDGVSENSVWIEHGGAGNRSLNVYSDCVLTVYEI